MKIRSEGEGEVGYFVWIKWIKFRNSIKLSFMHRDKMLIKSGKA